MSLQITPITLQELRPKLDVKAKAEPQWRFWGLYDHVCKMETLRATCEMAKSGQRQLDFPGLSSQPTTLCRSAIDTELSPDGEAGSNGHGKRMNDHIWSRPAG
jgi:hypothetical protein